MFVGHRHEDSEVGLWNAKAVSARKAFALCHLKNICLTLQELLGAFAHAL